MAMKHTDWCQYGARSDSADAFAYAFSAFTLRQKAQRCLQAATAGDPRYAQLVAAVAARTGMSADRVQLAIAGLLS